MFNVCSGNGWWAERTAEKELAQGRDICSHTSSRGQILGQVASCNLGTLHPFHGHLIGSNCKMRRGRLYSDWGTNVISWKKFSVYFEQVDAHAYHSLRAGRMKLTSLDGTLPSDYLTHYLDSRSSQDWYMRSAFRVRVSLPSSQLPSPPSPSRRRSPRSTWTLRASSCASSSACASASCATWLSSLRSLFGSQRNWNRTDSS